MERFGFGWGFESLMCWLVTVLIRGGGADVVGRRYWLGMDPTLLRETAIKSVDGGVTLENFTNISGGPVDPEKM